MAKYCLYKSDPTKTKFYFVENCMSEEDGRESIGNYLSATVFQEDFKNDKVINLHLYKGVSNITGKPIVSVTFSNHNYKP